MAALDARTCPRCGGLDGKIIPLEEKMQGENAPPMHPRCRCTITAVLGDYGTRTAKVKGRREKIPLSMDYASWKEKYLNAEKENIKFEVQRLPAGDYNLNIRRQVQNRHIEGTKEYAEYVSRKAETTFKPSKMPPDTDAQALVREFHGKGIYDPNPKDLSPREIVNTGRVIGQYWNNRQNKFENTTWLMIVYSKKGVHIYPIRPREEDK